MTAAELDALRADLRAAEARRMRAYDAWQAARNEANAADKALRDARRALETAETAAEFDRTHPALFPA